MARLKRHKKHIACLESLWDGDLEDRLSVDFILRTVARINGIKYAHFTCNTEAELAYNTKLLRRRSGYGVLYVSLHGYEGHISLDGCDLSLEQFAGHLGRGFVGWVIHFGTCSTIDVPDDQLNLFLEKTGAGMVVGYRESVHWIDSAALDLLFLDWIQSYKDTAAMWRRFAHTYPDLIALNGMSVAVRSAGRPRA